MASQILLPYCEGCTVIPKDHSQYLHYLMVVILDVNMYNHCGPGWARTTDFHIMSVTLQPTELQVQNIGLFPIVKFAQSFLPTEAIQSTVLNPYLSNRFLIYSLWKEAVVENIGVEPMTPCVQGKCSSQLS